MSDLLITLGAALVLAMALGALFGLVAAIVTAPRGVLWPDGRAEKQPPRWPPVPQTDHDRAERARLIVAAITQRAQTRWPPIPTTDAEIAQRIKGIQEAHRVH